MHGELGQAPYASPRRPARSRQGGGWSRLHACSPSPAAAPTAAFARHLASGSVAAGRASRLNTMSTLVPASYDIDDDPSRIHIDVVWSFLSTEAY